jgi:polyphenol oxidase
MSDNERFAAARRLREDGVSDFPPRFAAPALAQLAGVKHGFFGREGGVSQGIYGSLNAGPGSRDDPEHVAENRARIAQALGVEPSHLLSLHQIHSATAVRVEKPWSGERPQADALVTTTPGLALTALSADCTPVLFADDQAGVIGAAHAGWKGAVSGVLEACVTEMTRAGAVPSRIVTAIGPCIRQGSYEVGPEFLEAFRKADVDSLPFFRAGEGDRLKFDLPGYCRLRLARAGVTIVDMLPLDTYSEEHALFSHRRSVHQKEGDYGRNCAAIVLA